MLGVLEKHENQKFVDEIDTFTSLNPDHFVNRWGPDSSLTCFHKQND